MNEAAGSFLFRDRAGNTRAYLPDSSFTPISGPGEAEAASVLNVTMAIS